MHTAWINLDRSRGALREAKIKSKGFPILESREVNITFQSVLWNDRN
jgi:hypothetical protein